MSHMFILKEMMSESNRVIIIGGTSGIGLVTAQYLKNKGYVPIVAGRRSVDLEGIETCKVDVCSEESVAELFNVSLKQYDDINALVYAVGIASPRKSIEGFDKDSWDNIITTNVTGVLLTLKYSFAVLKRNRGRVVIVNSLASRRYSELSGMEYTASKAALGGLVRQLSIEWASDNVLINSVYPGMTMTPMLTENVSKSKLKEIEEKIPLGRIARPEEVARAIEFLINPENTYITGTGVDVCGGQYLNG